MTARKTPTKKVVSKKTPPLKKAGQQPVSRNILDATGLEKIVEMITEGKAYRYIARELGVGTSRLVAWIDVDAERAQACARARLLAAQAFEELAAEVIEDASDMFELSKAKELASHYRWRAKAANPKYYGDKVDVNATMDIRTVSDEAIAKQLANFGLGAVAAKQLGLEAGNAG